MALSTIPATDPSATGFGIPQNPDASAWRRCPTPGTGKSQFPPLLVKNPLKDVMIAVCEEEGLTQAQFIERLLERELTERGLLDVKTSHS